MRHYWNREDETRLLEEVAAVKQSTPARNLARYGGGAVRHVWPKVAARMLPLRISPAGCRSRWEVLKKEGRVCPTPLTPAGRVNSAATVNAKRQSLVDEAQYITTFARALLEIADRLRAVHG